MCDPSASSPETILLELAEGRLEPEAWLAWWSENAAGLEATLKRAWVLRLKPPLGGDRGPDARTQVSQEGACYILDAIKVPYQRSDRYRQGAEAELRAFSAAQEAKRAAWLAENEPVLRAIQAAFPKLGRFLRKQSDLVECLAAGASEADLDDLERSLGTTLPGAYRAWLRTARVLELPGLRLGAEHPFPHRSERGVLQPAEGMLCIADYFLEADGDQVLFDLREASTDDPPVFYYAHSIPEVRRLAKSFTAWIEGLPRSAAFR